MSLYDKVQEKRNTYRKEGDTFAYTLMGTLMGEIDRLKKTSTEVVPDSAVISVLKKLQSSAQQNSEFAQHCAMKQKFDREVEILGQFIPAQMTEDEISAIAETQPTLKDFMAFMSISFKGLYDGKLAADIWKGLQAK